MADNKASKLIDLLNNTNGVTVSELARTGNFRKFYITVAVDEGVITCETLKSRKPVKTLIIERIVKLHPPRPVSLRP